MRIVIIQETGNHSRLGGRGSGEIIREKIKPLLDNGEKVILDFDGVRLATQAFLDEVFGIFVRAFGTDYIKNKLFIENVDPTIKNTINFVISYSRKRHQAAKKNDDVL